MIFQLFIENRIGQTKISVLTRLFSENQMSRILEI